jgi:hypothetical protein
MFDTEPTSIAATVTYKKRKSYFLLTYKDVLQEDFDSGISSIEISHLQTANRKQQTTNRKLNMAPKPTRQWGTTEGQFQSRLQNPKRANCNKTNRKTRTTTTGKQEISEQARSKHQPVNQ